MEEGKKGWPRPEELGSLLYLAGLAARRQVWEAELASMQQLNRVDANTSGCSGASASSSSDVPDLAAASTVDQDLALRFRQELVALGVSQGGGVAGSSCPGPFHASSSRLEVEDGKEDMMEADCATEPPLQERSKERFPLKRTRLYEFATRRRNREVLAFEQHVQELRKEISEGSACREASAAHFLRMEASQSDEMYDGEGRMDLTDDLLHKVFSCLDDTSLCKAAMVCRQWRVASSHENFWETLNFERRNVSHHQVRNLCHRYPNAVRLNLRCAMGIEETFVMDAIRSLKFLEVLILGKGIYGDSFFSSLASTCPVLRDLDITEAVLGSGCSQEIQIRHDSLRKLQIVKCRVLRVAVRCPQLLELSLRGTGTTAAMLICRRLQVLDVSSCHKLSDAGLRAAATECPLLSHLDISQCSFVTDETLRDIAFACTNLRSLDATYCPNVALEGVRMPMLVSLTLRNCEGINSSSMTALSHCYMLEEVLLDYCAVLTTVVLELPRLRAISLTNCRKFSELTLRCPSLVELNVAGCPTLSKIDIRSTSLEKLALNQQQGLSTIALQCPWLQEVDLADCDSLTDSLCDVFSDDGGCPRLSSLVLDNCEGLTGVKLSNSCLISLSLVGCRKVCSLQLDCPSLQRLLLDGCDHLTSASLCPVGLRSLNLGICPHLTTLTIKADRMTALDLRGCGVLQQAEIVCPSLLSLDASYCSQLGDECLEATTEACPLIQLLVLAACPSIGVSGLLALRKLRGLTVLDLSYTFLTNLSPIYDACPQLQVLRLSACKYLGDDALLSLHGGRFLPNLQELDLAYGSLGRDAIESLLRECPHLRHISLNGCSNVYDLDWSVVERDVEMEEAVGPSQQKDNENRGLQRALQTFNCVGCANIKRVDIPSAAGCVNLTILNLSLSTNITEVRLECSNLVTLNLSHCQLLVKLRLDCPRLTTLFLQASGISEDELEQCLKGCYSLETLDVRNCPKISSGALSRLRYTCTSIKRLYNSLLP